jgi:hypothetical protein
VLTSGDLRPRRALDTPAGRYGSSPSGGQYGWPAAARAQALHFMSLVRLRPRAVITVVTRVYWPPDGPGTDLAITHLGCPTATVALRVASRPAAGGSGSWCPVEREGSPTRLRPDDHAVEPVAPGKAGRGA